MTNLNKDFLEVVGDEDERYIRRLVLMQDVGKLKAAAIQKVLDNFKSGSIKRADPPKGNK